MIVEMVRLEAAQKNVSVLGFGEGGGDEGDREPLPDHALLLVCFSLLQVRLPFSAVLVRGRAEGCKVKS